VGHPDGFHPSSSPGAPIVMKGVNNGVFGAWTGDGVAMSQDMEAGSREWFH